MAEFPSAPPLAGARFIIIDDQRDLAENLREILEHDHATVAWAPSLADGVAAAQRGFDVALVDIRLPDGTGISLLPRLKAIDPLAAVVLITGHASIDDAIVAVRSGAYAYVLKPFDTPDLLTTAERAYEQVRLARRAVSLQAALERSEAALRTMVDAVEALLLVLDEGGHVVQANPAVTHATGVEAHTLVGMPFIERFVVAGEQEHMRRAVESVRHGTSGVSFEGRLQRNSPTGIEERIIRWRLSGLPTEHGYRVYASGLDMTETRALEQRTRLAEKLAAVGSVSAGLAHEIRNPLNAASLQLQLLQRRIEKLSDDERIRSPLALVSAELARLSRLVTDFLLFARPAALLAADRDLRVAVDQVVELERPLALQRGVELIANSPDTPVVVQHDPERIKQIVLNLVRNAVEASASGGHVDVTIERDGAGARITIRDHGSGIGPAHAQRIFEPFFTTKESGTGLGLAIVHSLVQRHGGTIEVRSSDGTEMVVTLPRHVP